MKLLLSDISTNLIIHNDLEHYVESRYGGKDIKKLGSSVTINIKPGDIIIIKTPGGGGYGKKATHQQ